MELLSLVRSELALGDDKKSLDLSVEAMVSRTSNLETSCAKLVRGG